MERGGEKEKAVSAVSAEPHVIHAVDVFPVGVEAADPNIEGDAIGDDFIYLLCCAFTFKNCEMPKCFGARSECTFLCYEKSRSLCKIVDDGYNILICESGGVECVHPRKLYSEYAQCFCCECYASLPPIQGKFKKIHDRHYQNTMKFKSAGDATFCSGSCCYYQSCNCNCATCWGMYVKSAACCYEAEGIAYKPMCCETVKSNPDTWCILARGYRALVWPKTFCKGICAFFCCDYRCALPCDEEVPCIYSMCCFCTCCVDWQFLPTCCNTINQISNQSRAKRGLPPIEYATAGAATTTATTTTSQYAQVAQPHAQPHAQHQHESHAQQYKAAPTSAPMEVAVAEQYEHKI